MTSVRIEAYDPAWPDHFERLRDRIAPALEGIALGIEHVGSTSVPGLDAKPVIDMTVVVRDEAGVREAIAALATVGYEHRGDLGIVGREAFVAPESEPRHNLYLCADGATPLINHRHVRDHLRTHEKDRGVYARLKRALANAHPDDIDRYTRQKTDFLMGLLEHAPLTPAQREEIRAQNT